MKLPKFLEINGNKAVQVGDKSFEILKWPYHYAEPIFEDFKQKLCGRPLVIKMFSDLTKKESPKEKNALKREVALIYFFRKHKNFVKLIGYSNTPSFIAIRGFPLGNYCDFIIHKTYKVTLPKFRITNKVLISFSKDLTTICRTIHKHNIIHTSLNPQILMVFINLLYRWTKMKPEEYLLF